VDDAHGPVQKQGLQSENGGCYRSDRVQGPAGIGTLVRSGSLAYHVRH
jgi:hypothetical protein